MRGRLIGRRFRTVASYYIDELRRAVAPSKIEAEVVRRDYEARAWAGTPTQ